MAYLCVAGITEMGSQKMVPTEVKTVQVDYNPMSRLKRMVGIPDSANFQDHRYCTIKWEERVKFVLDSLDKNIQLRRKRKRESLILSGIDPY